MKGYFELLVRLWTKVNAVLDQASVLFLLGTRLYLADVFLSSGLTKLNDFSTTVALFENEYKVPVLSPMLAAVAGTAAELTLPTLIALGIATRPTAVALSVFNMVACYSYPDIMPAGIVEHQMWAFMILMLVFYGPGKISVDRWLQKKYFS